MQDEVLKKRHQQINDLLKENTNYKNQIDNIRRSYGDLDEIETRLKVATLKEEKINSLLSKLDHVMVSHKRNDVLIFLYFHSYELFRVRPRTI